MDSGFAENPFNLNHACQHWVNCRAIWTPHLCRRPLASSRMTPAGGRRCWWAWSPRRPRGLWVWAPAGPRHTAHSPLRAFSPAVAEAGRPTPGPDAQPGLLPPVETTGGRPAEAPPRPAPSRACLQLVLVSPSSRGFPIPANHCPALPASFPGNLSKAKSLSAVSC